MLSTFLKVKLLVHLQQNHSWSSKKTELQQLQMARDEFIESISAQAVNGSYVQLYHMHDNHNLKICRLLDHCNFDFL